LGGLHVFIAGRTLTRIQERAREIEQAGGKATAICTDASDEKQVIELLKEAGNELILAVYNAGNNFPGQIIDMDANYFENSWKSCCYSGFLFGRQALRYMVPTGKGTLLFTGSSTSLRGRPNFGAFNSAKAGLRTLAQAMAKEYGPHGIHIGHVVVDGSIAGEKIMNRITNFGEKLDEGPLINLEGIVDSYVFL